MIKRKFSLVCVDDDLSKQISHLLTQLFQQDNVVGSTQGICFESFAVVAGQYDSDYTVEVKKQTPNSGKEDIINLFPKTIRGETRLYVKRDNPSKTELKAVLKYVKGKRLESSNPMELLEEAIQKVRLDNKKEKFYKIYSQFNAVVTNSFIDSLSVDEHQDFSFLLGDISEKARDAQQLLING